MGRREFYCETVLKMPPELGKQLLLETFFGKKVSNIDQWRDEAKAFLLSVESLGRLMRWVANEYFSDKELEVLEADPKVKLFVYSWSYALSPFGKILGTNFYTLHNDLLRKVLFLYKMNNN